jgi:hypothetical protein
MLKEARYLVQRFRFVSHYAAGGESEGEYHTLPVPLF